jgi:Gpi18-like mannosyltransferase
VTRPRLVALALAYLALRAALLLDPGYADDLLAYRRWALAGVSHGLGSLYGRSDMDYPPLYAYVLTPLGHVYTALVPKALRAPARVDPAAWTALVKLPPLVFDLAIAALLARLGARVGGRWRYRLPALYLLNPAVIFTTGYWGQPDSVHSFFALAAFLAVLGRRAWPGFVLLVLATLMKPLAAPLFPLLLLVAVLRHGWRQSALGLAAAAATALLLFAPFFARDGTAFVLGRVLGDLDAMAFTTVNAHNAWWLLAPWRDAEASWLGPLTPTQLGLAAFGAIYLALLARLVLRDGERRHGITSAEVLATASLVALSFFMLATHMHENHLFLAVVLLAALVPEGRAWVWAYAAVSAGLLANLALHGLSMPVWPLMLGGSTEVARPSHGRTFYAAELGATYLASLWNLAVFAWILAQSLRRGGRLSLDALAARGR